MIKCEVNGMKELTNLLNKVEDSYFDFVYAMLNYAKKREDRRNALVGYLKEHPDAKSADIILFVSEQPDFEEDAAYMNVG